MVLRSCEFVAGEKEPWRTKQVRVLEVKALLHASTCTHEGGEKWPAGTAINPPRLLGNNTGIVFYR